MKKALFIDRVHPKMQTALQEMGYDCIDLTSAAREEVLEQLPTAQGLVIRSRFTLDEQFLHSAPALKWIARSGIGLENIDTDYCASRDIAVFNAAGGNADAVGEQVIGMLLSLFRHIPRADHQVRQGIWQREANRGIELGHRTIGIIGYGNTGRSLARKLGGFGTTVLAYDKYRPVDGPYAQASSLQEIQSRCDVLSFHVPLTTETRHYFDADFLQLMEQPFYLVNASRGAVCSTATIAAGLHEGRLLGACLDVLEEEGRDFQLPMHEQGHLAELLKDERVLFSPHVAGWTVESYQNLAEVLLRQIQRLDASSK